MFLSVSQGLFLYLTQNHYIFPTLIFTTEKRDKISSPIL